MRQRGAALALRLAARLGGAGRHPAAIVPRPPSFSSASGGKPPPNRGGIDTATDCTVGGGGAATLAPAIAPFPSWLPRAVGGGDGGGASTRSSPAEEDIGRVSTPLTQSLPGLGLAGIISSSNQSSGAPRRTTTTKTTAAPPPTGASPPTRTTILPNGAAVVTEASRGPTSSLGVYVDCGSVHERPGETLGASAMLECSAFGATLHRPGARLAREIERLGASVSASASREQMAYTVDCLRSQVPHAAELLLDATLCPAFEEREVEANRRRLAEAVASGGEVQLALLAEALLRECYAGSPLGHPLIPAECVSPEEAARADAAAARAEEAGAGAREATLARGAGEAEAEAAAAEASAAAMAAAAAQTSSSAGGAGDDSAPPPPPPTNPYVCPLPLAHLTPRALRAFHAERFAPQNLVVAAAGVEDHEALVALVAPMLLGRWPAALVGGGGGDSGAAAAGAGAAGAAAPGRTAAAAAAAAAGLAAAPTTTATTTAAAPPPPPPAPPRSVYRGGHVHLPGPHPQSHLILAFEYAGGWRDVQGSVTMTVLTYLLGGGASFSSGGPGKGMHSRLYARVLNAHAWAHSCAAFSSAFNDTGLVGIQASCEPGRAAQMLDVCCRELESLSTPPPAEQVARARAMAASLVAGALEGKAASAEDAGRQHLTYGRRVSGHEYLEMIHRVTPRQVAEFARSLLATRPALATFGDRSSEAEYGRVLARYGASGAMVGGAVRGVELPGVVGGSAAAGGAVDLGGWRAAFGGKAGG